MFEIDVDNNKNAINELLDNQSQFLDPEVVDILKMLKGRYRQKKMVKSMSPPALAPRE
jgi:HD-GYP domain-containing protein (c-di-GMP phosphodiesterase class II)